MTHSQPWSDKKIEIIVGNLLRIGVSLSAFVVFCGGIVYLVRHGQSPADYHVFRGEPSDLRSVSGIVRRTMEGYAGGIIQLGLLLLIATPVARVAFSIFGFLEERDRLYAIFTIVVLGILLFSLMGSS